MSLCILFLFCIYIFGYFLNDYVLPQQFRKQIRSVAVNGIEIIAAANDAYKKSLARLEAKDAAAKAKAKREDERVENLKKIRGERWLPSMAQEMQVKIRH